MYKIILNKNTCFSLQRLFNLFVPRHSLIALLDAKGFEPKIFDQKNYSKLHTTKNKNSSLQGNKNFYFYL
jgi:hypothetical protein